MPRHRGLSARTPTWWPPPRTPSRSGVKVASVATAFPAGRAALDVKLADVHDAVAAVPTKIDSARTDRGRPRGKYISTPPPP